MAAAWVRGGIASVMSASMTKASAATVHAKVGGEPARQRVRVDQQRPGTIQLAGDRNFGHRCAGSALRCARAIFAVISTSKRGVAQSIPIRSPAARASSAAKLRLSVLNANDTVVATSSRLRPRYRWRDCGQPGVRFGSQARPRRSTRTGSDKKGLQFAPFPKQGRQDSNLQPPVLETVQNSVFRVFSGDSRTPNPQ